MQRRIIRSHQRVFFTFVGYIPTDQQMVGMRSEFWPLGNPLDRDYLENGKS